MNGDDVKKRIANGWTGWIVALISSSLLVAVLSWSAKAAMSIQRLDDIERRVTQSETLQRAELQALRKDVLTIMKAVARIEGRLDK